MYVRRTSTPSSHHCRWWVGSWSACSTSCDPGSRSRPVECKQRLTASAERSVSANRCAQQSRPTSRETCNSDRPCSRWKIGEWSQVRVTMLRACCFVISIHDLTKYCLRLFSVLWIVGGVSAHVKHCVLTSTTFHCKTLCADTCQNRAPLTCVTWVLAL